MQGTSSGPTTTTHTFSAPVRIKNWPRAQAAPFLLFSLLLAQHVAPSRWNATAAAGTGAAAAAAPAAAAAAAPSAPAATAVAMAADGAAAAAAAPVRAAAASDAAAGFSRSSLERAVRRHNSKSSSGARGLAAAAVTGSGTHRAAPSAFSSLDASFQVQEQDTLRQDVRAKEEEEEEVEELEESAATTTAAVLHSVHARLLHAGAAGPSAALFPLLGGAGGGGGSLPTCSFV